MQDKSCQVLLFIWNLNRRDVTISREYSGMHKNEQLDVDTSVILMSIWLRQVLL
jgi:hypothetical protein